MIEVKKWLSLALATLALYDGGAGGGVHGTNAICVRGRTWWDRQRGACVPCTRCEPTDQLAVRTPCEVHRDTTCISIYDPDIWPFAAPDNDTGPESDPDRRDYLVYDAGDGSVASDSVWDPRITTLTLAASGCVIFFVVVLTLSLSHVRQWRKLKQALRTDVEELSVKLKLMESGAAPAVAHHVYCNIPPRKDAFTKPATATKKGFGNVYTQEKHPS